MLAAEASWKCWARLSPKALRRLRCPSVQPRPEGKHWHASPYAQRRALFETYKRHNGPVGHPAVLVAQGASRDFNPSLPQSVIDRAMKRDEEAAKAEYLGEFRMDVQSVIQPATVEASVEAHVRERPPDRRYR